MSNLPTADYDSELSKGDKIDPTNPPKHCGARMHVWEEDDGFLLECRDDDYQFHTDLNGVLVEPPFTR